MNKIKRLKAAAETSPLLLCQQHASPRLKKTEGRHCLTDYLAAYGYAIPSVIYFLSGIRANRSGNAIRAALHYYNNKADVDKLVAFLKEYK